MLTFAFFHFLSNFQVIDSPFVILANFSERFFACETRWKMAHFCVLTRNFSLDKSKAPSLTRLSLRFNWMHVKRHFGCIFLKSPNYIPILVFYYVCRCALSKKLIFREICLLRVLPKSHKNALNGTTIFRKIKILISKSKAVCGIGFLIVDLLMFDIKFTLSTSFNQNLW